jgi:hypothetical protein
MYDCSTFGKFQYFCMSIPDVAQSIMEQVLRDLDVEVYIDDIRIFSNSWEDHCEALDAVLEHLQENGFKVNPLKCEWGVDETDFLGHSLTPKGVMPWKKKIDAILKMEKSQNITQLCSFLGAVTYITGICGHVVLTFLLQKSMFEWTPHCDKAFAEMKAVMLADTLMHYPNINIPFEIYTDPSDYQMGAVIMQNGHPVVYWSCKLNEAERNYLTIKKELLAIVHCLVEYRTTMLWGACLTVYTDHQNLTFRTLNTQRVLRWRLFLEDFHPTFKYCPGKDNVIADCFLRLP